MMGETGGGDGGLWGRRRPQRQEDEWGAASAKEQKQVVECAWGRGGRAGASRVPAQGGEAEPLPTAGLPPALRWQQFRSLADGKKAALTSALSIQNYHLECTETQAWMREKTKVIESTQGLGNDLAGVLALQRKLAGTERDLEAIAARVGELTREANALAAGHPAQAPAINARLGEVQAGWEDLRATMRRREESLGEARRLQDFLRSLDDFQAWLGRTQTAVASEEGPATLPEAEALLAQHAALRGEVERAQSEYSRLRALGEEVTRDQADPQCLFLRQRLEALGTGWEELGRMWESRQGRLAQAHGFQGFLRDARQAEGVLSSQVRAGG